MSAQIITRLKQLKLHGMPCHGVASAFPEVAAQARHADFNPETFMHQLIQSESAERQVRPYGLSNGRSPVSCTPRLGRLCV
jgi:hypothetical protein